ncbi:hypothetical protein [Microbacterium sp. ZOR0019]|uniref:hypothetical protein n=1 Tax=Microbacterium sp. ZOR0019 TaxID=1339233 RepID=UPI000A84BD8B|nr:hypothetical protein [Microbacterium sp. ZOR0019]
MDLISPGRDLGCQDIHGISFREILREPQFLGITADLVDLLSRRLESWLAERYA